MKSTSSTSPRTSRREAALRSSSCLWACLWRSSASPWYDGAFLRVPLDGAVVLFRPGRLRQKRDCCRLLSPCKGPSTSLGEPSTSTFRSSYKVFALLASLQSRLLCCPRNVILSCRAVRVSSTTSVLSVQTCMSTNVDVSDQSAARTVRDSCVTMHLDGACLRGGWPGKACASRMGTSD